MFVHGAGKLLGIGPAASGVAGFANTLGGLGFPAPGLLAWAVALVEAVGGLFVLLGLFTQVAALLVALVMLVATVAVHLPNGFLVSEGGAEFTFLLFVAAVSLVFTGAGRLSIDRDLLGREHRT